FFSSRRRHTRFSRDWSSDVCSSDLDSLEKAKLALCSKDRVGAVEAIYSGGELKVSGDCSAAEAAVKANTDFFHSAGFQGTPVIVRSDGTTNEGWLPVGELRGFLGGK